MKKKAKRNKDARSTIVGEENECWYKNKMVL